MLKKRHRLTVAAFDHSFSKGRRFHGSLVQLIYLPGDTFHGSAVVGKKVHKKAVDRNKLRRRMYAVLYSQHTTKVGTFICIAKPPAKSATFASIKAEIVSLLAKTGGSL